MILIVQRVKKDNNEFKKITKQVTKRSLIDNSF